MLKFTVSSHINSYKKTFDKLIKSLLASGVPAENIYFFIGGYDEYKKIENDKGIKITTPMSATLNHDPKLHALATLDHEKIHHHIISLLPKNI